MAGYRYALELTGGQAANPVFFNIALLPETWRLGDEFFGDRTGASLAAVVVDARLMTEANPTSAQPMPRATACVIAALPSLY